MYVILFYLDFIHICLFSFISNKKTLVVLVQCRVSLFKNSLDSTYRGNVTSVFLFLDQLRISFLYITFTRMQKTAPGSKQTVFFSSGFC